MEQKKNEFVKLAALWFSKNNPQVLTGFLGDAKIIVSPNKFAQNEKSPAYYVYVLNQERKEKIETKPVQTLQAPPKPAQPGAPSDFSVDFNDAP